MKPLPLKEAVSTVVDSVAPLAAVSVPRDEALGMVLAEDIIAPENVPISENSAMDGFAVRSSDLRNASVDSPRELDLLPEMIAAGPAPNLAIGAGTTRRIMTGAVIPSGCDAVVPVEKAEVLGDTVRFTAPAAPGEHIRPAGGDIEEGSVALEKGTLLDPASIGVAVLCKRTRLSVVRRPRVAVLTTGDEVIGAEEPMEAGLVRNSNSPALIARLREEGYETVDLGVARDETRDLLEKITRGMESDVLITTGGVSKGERDYLREVFESAGIKLKFAGVRVKPGKPIVFGLFSEGVVFGLPGNPVSALTGYELFVRPALRKISGHRCLFPRQIVVRSGFDFPRKTGRSEFLRVRLRGSEEDGSWVAELTSPRQGSQVLSSFVGAEALLYIEPDKKEIRAGEEVLCLLIRDPGATDFSLS